MTGADFLKTVVLPITVGVAGWMGHGYLRTDTNTQVLAIHGQQLDKLWQGEAEARSSLKDLGLGMSSLSGKIDVLSQKVDDAIVIGTANNRIAMTNNRVAIATAQTTAKHLKEPAK